MPQWRYRTAAKTGRWYLSRRDAEDAAIYAGVGRCDKRGEFHADPFTLIETRS
jgi:hypothetical protein